MSKPIPKPSTFMPRQGGKRIAMMQERSRIYIAMKGCLTEAHFAELLAKDDAYADALKVPRQKMRTLEHFKLGPGNPAPAPFAGGRHGE